MTSSSTVRRLDRRTCPHCDRCVFYKTCRAHYYDAFGDSWTRATFVGETGSTANHDLIRDGESPPRLLANTAQVVDVEPEDDHADDLHPPSIAWNMMRICPHHQVPQTARVCIKIVCVVTLTIYGYFLTLIDNDEEVWDETEEIVLDYINPPSLEVSTANNIGDQNASVLMRWIITFTFYLKSKYKLSDAVANVILKFMSILFRVLGAFSPI